MGVFLGVGWGGGGGHPLWTDLFGKVVDGEDGGRLYVRAVKLLPNEPANNRKLPVRPNARSINLLT
jgi:hypothetical protein